VHQRFEVPHAHAHAGRHRSAHSRSAETARARPIDSGQAHWSQPSMVDRGRARSSARCIGPRTSRHRCVGHSPGRKHRANKPARLDRARRRYRRDRDQSKEETM